MTRQLRHAGLQSTDASASGAHVQKARSAPVLVNGTFRLSLTKLEGHRHV